MKQYPQSMHPLGLYLAIPFCRAKCSFCNFASDAFAPGYMPAYVDSLVNEIQHARPRAKSLGSTLPPGVDTIYLGGGTPSLLAPPDLRRIFTAIQTSFTVSPDAEITVECAPRQLAGSTLDELLRQGVNRLSFGVQSFNHRETSAIGRTHSPAQAIAELDRVRRAGILNLSLDLIAGLPHQTGASWRSSIETAIATGVPHISVYMLEVDQGSRLGREVLARGSRYGAPAVPSDDQAADLYEIACDLLEAAGIPQYEISNFARPGFQSAHNRKYWLRKPYLGLGLDAHSMLHTPAGPVRCANTDNLDTYLAANSQAANSQAANSHAANFQAANFNAANFQAANFQAANSNAGNSHAANFQAASSLAASSQLDTPLLHLLRPTPPAAHPVPLPLSKEEQLEEALFLGLRLNEGLSLTALAAEFGLSQLAAIQPVIEEAAGDGLLTLTHNRASLTPRGRVLSNEVFSRLLLPALS